MFFSAIKFAVASARWHLHGRASGDDAVVNQPSDRVARRLPHVSQHET